ncbi:MAG TPA: hypothetical protein DCR81_01470 [Smithella sp.]|nr:hypothetical protein [Smithella sp.]
MPMQSTVTAKGQITIPKPIRDAIGIKVNDRVNFTQKGEIIYIQPVKTLQSFRGAVKKKTLGSFEMERARAKAAVAKKLKRGSE